MSNAAQTRGWRKGIRSFLQTLAGGGFTGAIALISGGLSPAMGVMLTVISGSVIAYLQNYLESAGKIPILLPTPGLISAVLPTISGTVSDVLPIIAPPVIATVEAVVDPLGKVVGKVTDIEGDVIGTVAGMLDEDDRGPTPGFL